MRLLLRRLLPALCACFLVTPAWAEVGDPTIRTDHPHYAGEGAFQSVEDCVAFATAGIEGEQKQAIALYQWILAHQFHLHSPQEWNVPGVVPGATGNQDMIVYDANRARFSYGYGLCGTVHAWNEVYWKALGMQARRRAFPGHTNSEIFYSGDWHAFDTDMAGLVFRPDGIVAGYADIAKNPAIVKQGNSSLPCYPFAWPADFNGMKRGWEQIAKGGNWYAMYNAGYAGQPGVVQLRSGEVFTRYFDRDHFGGPSKRRFWHKQPGGPFRDWTFVNNGEPVHEAGKSNGRGNASYTNAEFIYTPNLAGDAWSEGVAAQSDNLRHSNQSPHLGSASGTASVAFAHFSPYVICGDPADDADPMTKSATDGLVVSGMAIGRVTVDVSNDQGQSWQERGQVTGPFNLDLTEQVKGHYGWQVRFSMPAGAGLDAVKFATTCQMNQAMYPRLTPGGCEVTYRAASRGVTPVLPNFGLAEAQLSPLEARELRTDNLAYAPRSAKNQFAYVTKTNKPGMVTFRVASKQPLLEVRGAMRYKVRVPVPEGAHFGLEISTNGGKSWREMAKSEIPKDNEYSSGWVYGAADVSNEGVREALVRATVYQGGYQTGLFEFEAYGLHQTSPPQGAQITYGWLEGKTPKTHTETAPAGKEEHVFRVPTGAEVRDSFIRIAAP